MQQFSWRRYLVPLAIALMALFAPDRAEAQTGKISGVVTDAANGQPIEGVQVRVVGTGFGAMTNAAGRFFIISVPPGTYNVEARRIGYQPQERVGVSVLIDVTREVNFSVNSAASQLAVQRIEAERTPLVEPNVTASRGAVQQEVIEALPVTSVSGVLALQSGFFQAGENTDIVSFSESRRNVQSPIRIRGGRSGETLTLIDGIPIANMVFGGPAFDIATTAVQQIDFQKGGFEAQYGNALSGIINIATRDGGTNLAGNLEYQTSALGGAFGSNYDDLLDRGILRGFLSGPVPGTSDKLRFMFAGQQTNGRDRVLEFDNDVSQFSTRRDPSLRAPLGLDLISGLRAFGYDRQRDVTGKLTFLPTPTSTISVTAINYNRQRQRFDFDYLLTGFDPLTAGGVKTLEDSIGLLQGRNLEFGNIAQGSIEAERTLYSVSFSQRFGRSNLRLRGARFEQNRETCNFWQGVCLAGYFSDVNFTESFVAPGISTGVPLSGTDEFFGGETVKTNVFRADLESQVTDRHFLSGGLFWQQHDMVFSEVRNQGTNAVFAVPARYSGKPSEVAAYIQDKIEYDFLTVNVGARFDYAKANGTSFANPLDPSNGTTVREVCDGTAPSVGATTPYTFTDDQDRTFTGFVACNADTSSAGRAQYAEFVSQARGDDFEKAKARASFNPRIGISFPLSERSGLFFNFGRYAQNPVYNNLYQNTGIGTIAGPAGGGVCDTTSNAVRPGSNECLPAVFSTGFRTAFLGNPNLELERTTSYEIGYSSEFGRNYALTASVFSKDQTGLSGVKNSRPTNDPAAVYGSAVPSYTVIVNQDYQTVRGMEVQLRRRIAEYWGFDLNYSFSRATTNSAAPDLQEQLAAQNDPTQRVEITSEIDQPHVFNTAVFFRVDDRAPEIRFGNLLRNTFFTVTHSIRSGLPYTPTVTFQGTGAAAALNQNSGRAPSTMQTDMQAGKDFNIANLRYGAFVRVSNLFDRQNCEQVFVTTGRCTEGTTDQDRAQNGNVVTQAAASSTFFDRPHYYGARRSVLAGLRMNF